MDLGTLIGLALGLGCIYYSIAISAPISAYWDLPSFIMVIGGMIASVLINFSLKAVLGVFGIVRKTIQYPLPSPTEVIEQMVGFANLARREGLLALEEKLDELGDEFQAKGLRMVIDGLPGDQIKSVLETDLYFLQERHGIGKQIMDAFGASAPAFGMIGTLVGLVAMLKNMSDPSSIGVGMAVALLTTFYGAFLANMFFLPLSGKLEQRNKEEARIRALMVEAILSIQAGDKPQIVEEKLKSFLAPPLRKQMEAAKA